MRRSTEASAGERARERSAALDAYAILDTDREPAFDDIVGMAAKACGTPIAHINFFDGRRQWFKAEVGLGRRELQASATLCATTLERDEIFVVPDIAEVPGAEDAVRDLGPTMPRFYAGVPLRTPAGLAIGTLCVLDHRPRDLDDQQLFILKALARSVMAQLDLRRAVAERDAALERERRAEAERRTGDARSRQVLDSAIDYGIVSTDIDGLVTGWNEGARRIMGWTEAEMLGRPAALIFTPEDRADGRVAAEMANTLRDGRGTDERWHMKRDDTRFWADGEMMALRDEAGVVTGFLKILRDRTERRATERSLRESQERFEAALASGLVGFVDWDAGTGLVRGDGRFAAFLGVSGEAATAGVEPHGLFGRIHADDRDAVRGQILAGFPDGADFVVEFRLPLDGGDPRWLLLSGRCYRAEGGEPQRLTGIAMDVTASRATAAALRASEELNRRVLAASADCIKVMDLDGTVRFVNAGGLRALEIDDEATLLGKPWRSIWPAGDGGTIEEALAAARAGGTGRFRGRAETAKGNLRWWDVAVTPIVDAGGRPERLLCVSRDMTAEILSEREQASLLAERDAERLRLKAVLDAAPVGILFAEAPSGRIVGQNPRADLIFGHGLIPTDAVEQHRDRILYTPDHTRLETDRYPLVRAIAAGETSAGEEYLYRRGDDTLAWIQLTAAPIRDAAGAVAGGVVCVEDIAARKAAEGALRRLNETLEATVAERTRELDSIWRHSRDMLCVARFDGTFLRLNPAWAETLGWGPEDLLGRPFIDLVHPDDRAKTVSAMAVLGDGLSVPGFENRYHHRDGSYRWFSWNAVPHDGLIYAIVRDVTDEKHAAAALAKAEEALRQSQKMEAVGQLTGGIAHDFNNLLTGITGALDLMQRRIGQGRIGEVGRYVGVAIASSERAAALTHRLLAFSRRQPLDPCPTDANRLVGAMEDLLRRTTGEAIAFGVALAPDLWPTLCDPHQLENALLNLVINARDAMPDGGRLTIETANVSIDEAGPDGLAPGDYVALSVADTGLGMAPEVAARAFDPFFTTKPMGQGTGLGLSMIYGFVRQSEGRVAIDSAVGRGTRVRIVLPRFAGTAPREVSPPAPGATPRAPTAETVLVVEDEPSVRDLVVEVLGDLGYRALQAPDGPAGFKVLQREGERIDLLVTDVGLPGMNGRQLAEQGRRLRPGLKVLFITGYAEDATFGEGHLDPGLQMLTKPFSIDALAGRIRSMIEAG